MKSWSLSSGTPPHALEQRRDEAWAQEMRIYPVVIILLAVVAISLFLASVILEANGL